jgi:fatty-acyl-CoA synthase
MEVPLSPLEFFRRARRLYADRSAVVDGDLRLTYVQFGERSDRKNSEIRAAGQTRRDRSAITGLMMSLHGQASKEGSVPV